MSVKGMSLWAAESTHGGGSVRNKANRLGGKQTNTVKPFSAGSSTPGGPVVPIARAGGIFALTLSPLQPY